ERRGDVLAPAQRVEVHEQGARRVGHVRDVHAAVDAAREVPQRPRVGVAEQHVAGLRLLARTLDVVEDPLDLRAREVRGERQADDRLVLVGAVRAAQLVDDLLGARVLPDDGVVHRLARGLVPHDGRLALVGDADRRDVVVGDVRPRQREAHGLAHVVPDLLGVVLHPPGAGEDLVVLELTRGDDLPGVVEDDGPGAGGSLVDGENVVGHGAFSPSRRCGCAGRPWVGRTARRRTVGPPCDARRRGSRGRDPRSRPRADQMYAAPSRPASTPPTRGPATGTQEQDQSPEPLPLMGSRAWAMRGARSRAGLMAYPVGPPRLAPMPTTMSATASGPRPDGVLPETTTKNTSTKVAMTSVRKFHQ